MDDLEIRIRANRLELAKILTDLATREQDEAERAYQKSVGMKGGQRALALGEYDKHTARSGAFIQAALLALGREKDA